MTSAYGARNFDERPTGAHQTLARSLFGCGPGTLGLLVALILLPGILQSQTPTSEPASGWHLVTIPRAWRKLPKDELAPEDGYSWYRALVHVPQSWEGARLTLYVEALDDARASYINGVNVGATGTFPPRFRSGLGEQGQYPVSADLIRFGELNTVAIRVFQNDPRPNFNVAPPVLLNADQKQAIRLNGQWQYRPGDETQWSQATAVEFGIKRESLMDGEDRQRGVFAKVDSVEDIERYVARRDGDNDPYSPSEAQLLFETPDDLEFQLVLSEPAITQPLFLNWDARGRLWVMEYRQYPNPAGLKMLSRDVFLRSVYDKVPAAPPNHVPGRDRISIHEDTDDDGVYDSHKVFIDGLNLATSFAHGHGGLWVTNPPYLLFYPDRDGDDVVDGDPEVHLEGFGLEDSHSVINSIRFGPDGWLYGAQGSTVSAMVRKPGSSEEPIRTMGQQIWRYHPQRRKFEVFAEGGGNTFGVEIDRKGRIYSGHNGGNTRGFHYVQGGYYRKGFGKHGPLSNPYAFGYFDHIKHHDVARFTHNFVIYEAQTLPASYRGRLFGIEPLQGQVVMSSFEPFQSSFQSEDLSRPVKTDDQWFRPVDIKVGPDGCIYVADMYEQRISHSSHYAGRIDRTNGRIYRLKPKDMPPAEKFDYTSLSAEELIPVLNHPNKWHRQTALRLIGDRQPLALAPILASRVRQSSGQQALDSLWALHLCGGLNQDVALDLLSHHDRFVRAWTVRLLGDRNEVNEDIAQRLKQLAQNEPYIEVRKQLASSARRLKPEFALPIIRNLLTHDQDAADIHQPLLIWWALEVVAGTDHGRKLIVRDILTDRSLWHHPLMQEHVIQRLMKRYALSGSRKELVAAARLLRSSPDPQSTERLLNGFEEAYQGRSMAGLPSELADAISESGGGSTALKLRQGDTDAVRVAIRAVTDDQVDHDSRLQYLQIFGEIRQPNLVPVLLRVARQEEVDNLVSAALTALQAFDDPEIGESVVELIPDLQGETRVVAETLLASRSEWALSMLQAVDHGELAPTDLSTTAIRKTLFHSDPLIQKLVTKHWGTVAGATTDEMLREVERMKVVLQSGSGNPKKGKPLFMQHCGKCHQLFGEGRDVGPDLTAMKRDDLHRVLISVINPSAEIREGYENQFLLTADGRAVTGFLADQDNQVVVIRGVDGQNLIFRRDEIDELRTIPQSVMPEGTLKDLSEQQLRDLFAYFRSSQPVNY